MIGRLKEISPWLNFAKSSWTDKAGAGRFGWEEMPYWLKGYADLGYVLRDKAIQAEAKEWIDKIIMIYDSMGRESPKEGEEPPALTKSKPTI